MQFSLKSLFVFVTLVAIYCAMVGLWIPEYWVESVASKFLVLWLIPVCLWSWRLLLQSELAVKAWLAAAIIGSAVPVALILMLAVYAGEFFFGVWIAVYVLAHSVGIGAGIGCLFVQGKRVWGAASLGFFLLSVAICWWTVDTLIIRG